MFEIGSEFNYEEQPQVVSLLGLYDKFNNRKFMRCGRDSIGFIADDILECIRNSSDKEAEFEDITAFLPALSCDSMYLPFEVRGVAVEFYAINDDLTVQMDSLDERLKYASNPVVLTMNYYGAADQKKANRQIKELRSDAIIIEDVTHLIFNTEKWDTEAADYEIGSIRKWLGVPDGAIVVKNSGVLTASVHAGDTDFTTLRDKALHQKSDYLVRGGQDLKAEFRGLLSDAEDSLDNGLTTYEMSERSRKYLESVDVQNIRKRRKDNYDNLYKLLSDMPECGHKFRLLTQTADDNTPFMLPIVLNMAEINKDKDYSQDIADGAGELDRNGFERLLAMKGVYAPVLWPIDEEAEQLCPVSKDIADNMLTFWIDQRYDRFHMEYVVETMAELFR